MPSPADSPASQSAIPSSQSVHPDAASQADAAIGVSAKTLMCTDSGNAEWFAAQYKSKLCYDHRKKCWFIWRKHWWAEDTTGQVHIYAKKALQQRRRAAVNLPDERRMAENKWCAQSESINHRFAMVRLARHESAFADEGDEWDANPWLLGVANGVVDLKSGKLRPGQPEDRITRHSPTQFDPDAKCPRWEQFLNEIFDGDQETIHYIWKCVGYSFSGSVREECLFLLLGGGRNGKSKFLGALLQVIGRDYYEVANFALFMEAKYGEDAKAANPGLAKMRNARLVMAAESDRKQKMAEGAVKKLTGRDLIAARDLFEKESNFQPQFKIWLLTNNEPTITGTDDGIWSRIRKIPFNVSFTEGKADLDLPEKLKDEAPGILAWAVRGCVAWQHEGLGMPPAVASATSAYRAESDHVPRFLDECFVDDPNGTTTPAQIQGEYRQWSADNGVKPLPWTAVTERLKKLGYQSKRGHGGARFWSGLRLSGDRVTEVTPLPEIIKNINSYKANLHQTGVTRVTASPALDALPDTILLMDPDGDPWGRQ